LTEANEKEMIKKPMLPVQTQKAVSYKQEAKSPYDSQKKEDTVKANDSLEKHKVTIQKKPASFFGEKRSSSSLALKGRVIDPALGTKPRDISRGYETKPRDFSQMSPIKSTDPELKYSPLKNVNNVIKENLSLISHIRSSREMSGLISNKKNQSIKNQIKIIQNNLENNDPFNRTLEGDIANLSFITANTKDSYDSKKKSVKPNTDEKGTVIDALDDTYINIIFF